MTSPLKDTFYLTVVQEALHDLAQIDKTWLQGRFKVWILQLMWIPKLLWPLQMYEFTLSTVESLEKKFSQHMRKWLGLPPS